MTDIPSTERYTHPWGWYPVAFSRELKPGKVTSGNFAGSEIVVYRTGDGQACVVRPFCPHLGAHLADGRVEGRLLVCPFHAFAFAPDGSCARTGYGTPPPPGARLTTLPAREAYGLVFAWHHDAGAEPTWDIEAPDLSRYGRGFSVTHSIRGNQIDALENAVDIGHFSTLHGVNAEMVGEPRLDGHRIAVDIDLSGFYGNSVVTRARVEIFGLGYITVRFDMPRIRVSAVELVGYTPESGDRMTLRRMTYGRLGSAGVSRPAALAMRPATDLIGLALKHMGGKQVTADLRIWSRRAFVERPKLAQGDGPIMLARRWAQQFYGEPHP